MIQARPLAVGLPDSGSRRLWPYLARFGLVQAVYIIPYGGRCRRLCWPPDLAAFFVFAAVGNGFGIQEGRPPRRIRRAATKAAAAFASSFIGLRLCLRAARVGIHTAAVIFKNAKRYLKSEKQTRRSRRRWYLRRLNDSGAAFGRWPS